MTVVPVGRPGDEIIVSSNLECSKPRNLGANSTTQESTAGLEAFWPMLATLTANYFGVDIKQICRDSAMAPMRRVITGVHHTRAHGRCL